MLDPKGSYGQPLGRAFQRTQQKIVREGSLESTNLKDDEFGIAEDGFFDWVKKEVP